MKLGSQRSSTLGGSRSSAERLISPPVESGISTLGSFILRRRYEERRYVCSANVTQFRHGYHVRVTPTIIVLHPRGTIWFCRKVDHTMPPNIYTIMASNEERSLQELRVADQELSSGSQQGKVYVQLSPGAVAFLSDRPVAQARVSRQLHGAIVASPVTPPSQDTTKKQSS